jgi:hypothetical protein
MSLKIRCYLLGVFEASCVCVCVCVCVYVCVCVCLCVCVRHVQILDIPSLLDDGSGVKQRPKAGGSGSGVAGATGNGKIKLGRENKQTQTYCFGLCYSNA